MVVISGGDGDNESGGYKDGVSGDDGGGGCENGGDH